MTLFESIQRHVQVSALLNDAILFTRDETAWQDLVDRNRLDSTSADELSDALAYWQGLHDAQPDQQSKDIIWLKMQWSLGTAFVGCDRNVITEQQFTNIIGYTP